MGTWTIIIKGTGPHHNHRLDYLTDADRMAAKFVADLAAVGHDIHQASIAHGASTDFEVSCAHAVEDGQLSRRVVVRRSDGFRQVVAQLGGDIVEMAAEAPPDVTPVLFMTSWKPDFDGKGSTRCELSNGTVLDIPKAEIDLLDAIPVAAPPASAPTT